MTTMWERMHGVDPYSGLRMLADELDSLRAAMDERDRKIADLQEQVARLLECNERGT